MSARRDENDDTPFMAFDALPYALPIGLLFWLAIISAVITWIIPWVEGQ